MLKKQKGFTLMEVIVALFILSLMSITAVSGLNAILRAQSHQVGTAHLLQDLQMTYAWLEQDLGQHVPREVYNAKGERLPSLMLSSDLHLSQVGVPGTVLLALTRGGIANPQNLSSLQRVAYALEDKQLIRYTWAVLDAVPATAVRKQILLHDVGNIQLRYLSQEGNYYLNWRDYAGNETSNTGATKPGNTTQNNSTDNATSDVKLPIAIEWQVTDEKQRNVTWLFSITGGGFDKNESNETNTTTTQQ